MISLASAINISISVSGLAIAILGLIQSISSRKMEGWNRKFFIILFLIMTVYIGSVLAYSISSSLGTGGNLYVSEISMFIQSLSSFLLVPMLALLVRHFIRGNYSYRRADKCIYIVIIVFFTVVYTAILSTVFFSDSIYYFTPDNVYHRGPYYLVILMPPMICMLFLFIALLRRRKDLTGRQFRAMLTYILIAVICVPLQTLLEGIMVFVSGTSLSGIVMFSLLEAEQVDLYFRKREENLEQKMHLLSLQIRPHFICNTLLSIYYLCDEDQKRASEAILKFTDYLQKNYMAISKESLIPLSEELEHVKAYLEVEKVRYDESLFYSFDIHTDDFLIPPLTLQPIVENSVKHGIDPSGKVLNISIKAEMSDGKNTVIITDDGVGDGGAGRGGTHIAIDNIRKRLDMMCKGTFEMKDRSDGGKIVTICIPELEKV